MDLPNFCSLSTYAIIDAFISFGLQAKMSLQRRIGPIFRASVCDTFNVAYD
jgi:hypothetical protein